MWPPATAMESHASRVPSFFSSSPPPVAHYTWCYCFCYRCVVFSFVLFSMMRAVMEGGGSNPTLKFLPHGAACSERGGSQWLPPLV